MLSSLFLSIFFDTSERGGHCENYVGEGGYVTPAGYILQHSASAHSYVGGAQSPLSSSQPRYDKDGNRRIAPTQNCTHEIKNVFMMLISG